MDEAPYEPHNEERKTFIWSDGAYEPTPAPKLSRTPGCCESKPQPKIGEHSMEVLQEIGYTRTEIQQLISEGVVDYIDMKSSLWQGVGCLFWPFNKNVQVQFWGHKFVEGYSCSSSYNFEQKKKKNL